MGLSLDNLLVRDISKVSLFISKASENSEFLGTK